jgi:hypothetical protein
MEGAKVLRLEKGSQSPSVKGEGSVYIIPADDSPDGIQCGEKYKILIEGVCNMDEQGLIINVDRISAEKYINRTNPIQDSLEAGFKDEMSKNK